MMDSTGSLERLNVRLIKMFFKVESNNILAALYEDPGFRTNFKIGHVF